MFLRFGNEQFEICVKLEDIDSFGKYQRPSVCQPVAMNGNNYTIISSVQTMLPEWEYWVQMDNYRSDPSNRIIINELEYNKLKEYFAPEGAELYGDPSKNPKTKAV